jgi:hypothetical protein
MGVDNMKLIFLVQLFKIIDTNRVINRCFRKQLSNKYFFLFFDYNKAITELKRVR